MDKAKEKMSKNFIITESNRELSCANQVVIRWNGFSNKKLEISVSNYVEENGESLKKKYIDWNEQWIQSCLKNKLFSKYCRINGDFEYLKASRIYEKSIWKSPMFDAIKLIALEEILLNISSTPNKVTYAGRSTQLHQSYKILCGNLGITYSSNSIKYFEKLAPYNTRYAWIPESFKAAYHLVYRFKSLYLYRNKSEIKQFNKSGSFLFCIPFFNFNCNHLREGETRSEFLKQLPDLIKDNTGMKINWLHYFVKSEKFPNDSEAIKCLKLVQEKKIETDVHRLLGEHATLSILVKVFINWLKISTFSFVVKKPVNSFQPLGSKVSLWPILKNDWFRSLRGTDLIDNLLFYELFNNVLEKTKPQKYGLILYENQSIERIFSYLWHKHDHGRLIGVVHSTVRFWDLRYTFNYKDSLEDYSTQPDIIAVNGKVAWDELRVFGYPIKMLFKVEALRYNYLGNGLSVKIFNKKNTNFFKRILVLGDYCKSDTNELMTLINNVIPNINQEVFIHFKPHPNYSIKETDFPNLKIVFEKGQLEGVLSKFHVAITTNKTTSSVEAYIAGLKTIVMLNKYDLNFSPLRKMHGVSFVSSENDLIKVLDCDKNFKNIKIDFFYLDPNFMLWKKMLKNL